jgi:hypothetical protein
VALGEPNGNNFAPGLPTREPDEVQCEIRSCPRPAESVLLLRGQFRTRCVTHAMELRRQGATLTELDPGFDHPPGQPPETVPSIPEVPVCKIADCTSPAKTRGFCVLHWGRGLRVLHITSAAQVSDEDMHAAILRWVPSPHGPTPKAPEVTNADTPAPATPAPSPEPSGGITEVINCVTRLVDGNERLRREMDDSFSAGWRKASGEPAALGKELVEAQRDLARAHGEIQNLKDDRDDDRERSFQANNAVATAGARLRDVLRKIAGFSDDEVTTPSDEVIIERALAEHRRRNQVDANHLDVLMTLQRPRLLTEEDLERRFAALVESRKLRAIALGEVHDA